MWYETEWFVIVMMLMSALMIYSSYKRLKMTFEKASEDLKDSIKYANGFGKYAILFFTGVTVALTVAYVGAAGISGLLPIIVVYALVAIKLIALMMEYGALQKVWGYGKKSFAFDKIQCWINLVTAVFIVFRFFMTGLVRV